MSRLDSFFNKGFNAVKCRTLLKLTVPRIKLLRNRKEVQIKQMRREIAKLLETGQEATAWIKVEHIIREEKMMAAQEIIELFCELITVRLPIVEAQRECPLDLKEAISSVCYAAPRCVDLPELLQVQILFTGKHGKEFVLAATELRPECGVNRQLIELLSIRAPPPEVKLELLKEIAEEHELDWDPSASETELLKPHEDLLNGPMQFVSGSKLPFPERASKERSDCDDSESIDFPEVPIQLLRSSNGTVSAPEMLPFPASALSDTDEETPEPFGGNEILLHKPPLNEIEKSVRKESESSNISSGPVETKQFVPFISAPEMLPFPASALSDVDEQSVEPSGDYEISSQKPSLKPDEVLIERSVSNECEASIVSAGPMGDTQVATPFPMRQNNPPRSASRTTSYTNVDLNDVLAAVEAAAEAAELAAAAARSAAILAQLRINEFVRGETGDVVCDIGRDNPFPVDKKQARSP